MDGIWRCARIRRNHPRRDPDESANSERDEPDKIGGALIVRNLATRVDTTFWNVTDHAWQTKGPLLAFTVGADGRRGNGVQLYDPSTGSTRVLDAADAVYSSLSWRKDAGDLLVMRSRSDPSREGPTQVLLAWTDLEQGVGQPRTLDPVAAGSLPGDKRIVSFRRGEWSKDGGTVFVGVADWYESPDTAKGDGADDTAAVDVWHWKDVDVMPLQKKRIATDRQRNLLAAWHVERSSLVPLARHVMEDVRPLEGQPNALVIDRSAFAMARSIGRLTASLEIVDVTTGVRTPVKDRLEDRYVQASPDGRFLSVLLRGSLLALRHRRSHAPQPHQDYRFVFRRSRVGCDRETEASVRRRRLDD